MKHAYVSVKIIRCSKNFIVGIVQHVFVRMVMCDEIINTVGNISTTVTSNMSTNFKTDYYILYMVLLLTIFLLKVGIICYHCSKYRSKQKKI